MLGPYTAKQVLFLIESKKILATALISEQVQGPFDQVANVIESIRAAASESKQQSASSRTPPQLPPQAPESKPQQSQLSASSVPMPPVQPPIAKEFIERDSRSNSSSTRRSYSAVSSGRGMGRHSGDESTKLILGIFGTVALAIGFFCPILRIPIIGGLSFFDAVSAGFQTGSVGVGLIPPIILLTAVLISAVALVASQYWLLLVSGLAAIASIITTTTMIYQGASADRESDIDLSGLVRFDFGIGVIVVGGILLLAAAAIPKR